MTTWIEPVAWEKRRPIKLQPHQKRLSTHEPFRYPFYVYWGMGSGKTIGGIACMQRLGDGENALVVCDKSVVEQWVCEIRRLFGCNGSDFARIRVCVQHYEHLDDANGARPADFQMVIVDEAHRFRNAWEKESKRMLSWMARIKTCPRVVFMSGTPIVHDAAVEYASLCKMMDAAEDDDGLEGRVSYYNPREDLKRSARYARVVDEVVACPMSWAQCFRYLLHRRQTFEIRLDGEDAPRTRVSSSRNTYNTLVRSVCNCPFPEIPRSSPKMRCMIGRMRQHDVHKQVVYSSRRDTGVLALLEEWRAETGSKAIFRIDGTMSKEERGDHIARFNKCMHGILFITDAGAQGVDLKRVSAMHVMEPADNVQEERQIVNRAVRFNPHGKPDAVVRVYRYVAAFPSTASVEFPWKRELYASGLFDRDEMKGITRRVQYALMRLIREDEGCETIDQRVLRTRESREEHIEEALRRVRRRSIEWSTARWSVARTVRAAAANSPE